MVRAAIVACLSVLLLIVGQPAAVSGNAEFGRTWAKDRVLRAGCHDYRYQYKVKSPEEDWALETFLVDPDKREVSSGQLLYNSDPARGSSTFRVCRNVTTNGKFKIRGKLTYGADDTVVWIEPGRFRFRKAS